MRGLPPSIHSPHEETDTDDFQAYIDNIEAKTGHPQTPRRPMNGCADETQLLAPHPT